MFFIFSQLNTHTLQAYFFFRGDHALQTLVIVCLSLEVIKGNFYGEKHAGCHYLTCLAPMLTLLPNTLRH